MGFRAQSRPEPAVIRLSCLSERQILLTVTSRAEADGQHALLSASQDCLASSVVIVEQSSASRGGPCPTGAPGFPGGSQAPRGTLGLSRKESKPRHVDGWHAGPAGHIDIALQQNFAKPLASLRNKTVRRRRRRSRSNLRPGHCSPADGSCPGALVKAAAAKTRTTVIGSHRCQTSWGHRDYSPTVL